MTFLKTFWREEYVYYSRQSEEALRTEIKAVLTREPGWDFNLHGDFFGENMFHLSHNFRFKGGGVFWEIRPTWKGRLYPNKAGPWSILPSSPIRFLRFSFSYPWQVVLLSGWI